MKLPDLSNSMYVAQLRYIQSIHEPAERRNPDDLVRHFMPRLDQWRSKWIADISLSRLRADPFYYYLVARTRYYDQVLLDAIAADVKHVVMIGCGSDTRSHRFMDPLRQRGVRVLECDQLASIEIKKRITGRWRPLDFVEYMPIDLNDKQWPAFAARLRKNAMGKTVVLMEGVSPYIDESSFGRFLSLLPTVLISGSLVAYDFKIAGANDLFGQQGRTLKPFRLVTSLPEVSRFHGDCGLHITKMELSDELCARLLPEVEKEGRPLFIEDGLLRLEVV
jgi:methyltransferase (TIGR00027 family)